jgi:hypothetical protein
MTSRTCTSVDEFDKSRIGYRNGLLIRTPTDHQLHDMREYEERIFRKGTGTSSKLKRNLETSYQIICFALSGLKPLGEFIASIPAKLSIREDPNTPSS